jgi:hypothetical protein
MKSTICIVEDREACEPCLRLLLLSLNRYSPGAAVSLFYPPAKQEFLSWIRKYPQVQLQPDRLKSDYGWNVKPQAIMHLMDQGHDEVIWIDSDVIVNRDVYSAFSNLNENIFVATEHTLGEERWDPNALRARSWGLPVGRVLPFGLNSGVLRVTRAHRSLMERWWELLQSGTYQDFQRSAWGQRPVHMLGDQDVLTALLTSKEFAGIPLHILQRGKDIIQFDGVYGYTITERLTNVLDGCAIFIHSAAGKPWSELWERPKSLREYIKLIYLDVSPYTISALPFRCELGCDTAWMEPHFALSKILRMLGFGRAALVGLPIAIAMEPGRIAKWVRRPISPDPSLMETVGTELSKQ